MESNQVLNKLLYEKDLLITYLRESNIKIMNAYSNLDNKIDEVNKSINNKVNYSDYTKLKEKIQNYEDIIYKNSYENKKNINLYLNLNKIYIKNFNKLNQLKIDFKKIKEDNLLKDEKIKEQKKLTDLNCKICFSNKINISLYPCGHLIYCKNCIKELYNTLTMNDTVSAKLKCPICQKEIEDIYDIYY
jgi:hypothetical protein